MIHALNDTIQDVLVRWHRMRGDDTLWVPGTDHAGIATQNVVEKALRKEGKRRQDLGREAFVGRVWEWKRQYGGTIVRQLRALGCSCDWSHERFTMDEGLSRAVAEVFTEMYEKDLVYRGNYIVNWCPRCGTALADDEIEHPWMAIPSGAICPSILSGVSAAASSPSTRPKSRKWTCPTSCPCSRRWASVHWETSTN